MVILAALCILVIFGAAYYLGYDDGKAQAQGDHDFDRLDKCIKELKRRKNN